jgi:hypothetical protein|tara:strand:+ start:561 stop:770 length:210 start_codon:yes stop_codon:yes gene_type:complete
MILGIIGFVFFASVGYFAYNIGQCIAAFTRLNKIINQKVFGVLGVLIYFYLVYANQVILINALSRPLSL